MNSLTASFFLYCECASRFYLIFLKILNQECWLEQNCKWMWHCSRIHFHCFSSFPSSSFACVRLYCYSYTSSYTCAYSSVCHRNRGEVGARESVPRESNTVRSIVLREKLKEMSPTTSRNTWIILLLWCVSGMDRNQNIGIWQKPLVTRVTKTVSHWAPKRQRKW